VGVDFAGELLVAGRDGRLEGQFGGGRSVRDLAGAPYPLRVLTLGL